jgi:hypothetical protein
MHPMGSLIYEVAPALEINDRALRHLQVVMVAKLRRQEGFTFSWDDEPDIGGDRLAKGSGYHGAVWVSYSSSLYFSYDSPQAGPLNRRWLDVLGQAAASAEGLRMFPEPTGPLRP